MGLLNKYVSRSVTKAIDLNIVGTRQQPQPLQCPIHEVERILRRIGQYR